MHILHTHTHIQLMEHYITNKTCGVGVNIRKNDKSATWTEYGTKKAYVHVFFYVYTIYICVYVIKSSMKKWQISLTHTFYRNAIACMYVCCGRRGGGANILWRIWRRQQMLCAREYFACVRSLMMMMAWQYGGNGGSGAMHKVTFFVENCLILISLFICMWKNNIFKRRRTWHFKSKRSQNCASLNGGKIKNT